MRPHLLLQTYGSFQDAPRVTEWLLVVDCVEKGQDGGFLAFALNHRNE